MQVSVVRSVAIGVIVVADAQDIWVVSGAQEQVQLTILVPRVLIDALNRYYFISLQVGSPIDQAKSPMRDYLIQPILLPCFVLKSMN